MGPRILYLFLASIFALVKKELQFTFALLARLGDGVKDAATNHSATIEPPTDIPSLSSRCTRRTSNKFLRLLLYCCCSGLVSFFVSAEQCHYFFIKSNALIVYKTQGIFFSIEHKTFICTKIHTHTHT